MTITAFEENFGIRYKRLNDEQRLAVDIIDGPVMVIAGPGSGKTELLSLRVANILRTSDVRPSNILCLTFTDAAAVNMRERLSSLLGADAYRVAIHTFHSFGARIIEENPNSFFGSARFSAVDELVQYEVLQEILETLPNDNPLSSSHPDQGYVFLKDIKSAISNLKRSALTPDNFLQILSENKEFYEFVSDQVSDTVTPRLSIKNLDSWVKLATKFNDSISTIKWSDDFYDHPGSIYKNTLERAIAIADAGQKTAELSEWKKQYTTKTSDGHVLKDQNRYDKMLALADIYQRYEVKLHHKGYFDFEDMLVTVVDRLKNNSELLHQVSEQYSYILIDEFQDTNDAQLKLVLTIARPELFDNKPNLMAVGDDDQAINRFQGADISNIRLFTKRLPTTKFIVLVKNYRSHADIIDLAKRVIRQGDDRLENIIAEIDKELVAANESITDVDIKYAELPSRAHEFSYIAERIKNLIDNGTDPNTIAVLGREHRQLQALVTHLHDANIPVRYERNLDVLKQKHIRELIQMARYVNSLADKDTEIAEELLPEILSYDFWELDRLSVWRLGQYAYQNRSSWQNAMENSDDPKINLIAEFFAKLSTKAHSEPIEIILDYLIGSDNSLLNYVDTDEYDAPYKAPVLVADWTSPFKEFYFGNTTDELKQSLYVGFLSNLRVFVQSLREYKQREVKTISDFARLIDLVEYVRLHDATSSLLTDTSPFVSAKQSVHVMTAHKSKGLEFDTVFVVNCTDEVWGKVRSGSRLSFPANLPIEPAGTTTDDNLRLFFVALTRAKHNLYLSSYAHNEKGQAVNEIRFISGLLESFEPDTLPNNADILTAEMHRWHSLPPAPTEASYLNDLVENYQLSVTHLNTFLDVTRGGPQTFFEQNLLRFPQGKTPASAYGSAIHGCLEHWWRKYKDTNKMPSLDDLLDCFNEAMDQERLISTEISRLRDRGAKSLTAFYDFLRENADQDDLVEKNFKHEGVQVDGLRLTGKIDLVQIDKPNHCAVVADFKTGKSVARWQASGTDAIKLHNYRRQLIFYKILMNNSNSFRNLDVSTGKLIFVEPDNNEIITLETELTDTEVERTTNLIRAVGQKIKALDFPDVSNYPQTLIGIQQFETDLLEGKI